MNLTTLAPEVFETILTYLDVDTVKALRLTDRKLAERCIGPRFLGSIQQPTFDVSPQNLRSLRALACNRTLKKGIHSLTLLATNLDSSELKKNVASGTYIVREVNGPFVSATTVAYTPKELSDAGSDLKWLKEQEELRNNESSSEMIELLQLALTEFGELDAIHLDGAAITGRTQRESTQNGEWHPLWMRASHVFSLVMTAILQSRIPVKKLNVYRNTPRCCIPSGHITAYASYLDTNQLHVLCNGLESFELSISTEIQAVIENGDSDEDDLSDYEKASRRTFGFSKGHLSHEDPRAVLSGENPGVTSILKYASSLKELDLSFRRALSGGNLHSYDSIIESIASETHFPRLESCALSGFMAKGQSILLLLQKHSGLRSLTLHECSLTTGSWTPIFAYLGQSMPKLESLSLSNLFGKHMPYPKHGATVARSTSNDKEQGEENDVQEVDGIVSLDPIWDTDLPPRWKRFSKGATYVVHTRSFNQAELKKGLIFRPEPGGRRPKGSIELMRWKRSRQALYGCP
ncbi:hypothetical protein N7508_005750 [Penicillium antarcticum]|uniref:uncharacterized protein n=1 Tax=Penicillium antarcticum TaxID=416450 RepID=UPI0023A065A4|nr:uncharacterized protein N7508_005750 [Penicillium antarcticum]KAJ5306735.1 hypothetical protein N7508_005750 [Penicillium antarcticum]